jgi:glycosyltransferase involved in cell wall biosynthesis
MISSLHGLYDDRIYWKEAISLKNHGYDVIHVGTGEADLDFISEQGIRLIQIRKKRYFRNPYLDIIYRRFTGRPGIYGKMFRICSAIRAEVYHYHDIQVNRIALKLKKLPHAPKVIYDVHEDFADLLLSQYPKPGLVRLLIRGYCIWLNRWELNRSVHCDYIIAAVEHIYDKFAARIGKTKTIVIYNYSTLDPDRLKPFDQKTYDAIYCGQINPFRGALQIAEAVKLVKQQLPDIRVLLLGPFPDDKFKAQIQRYIAHEALQDNVILHAQVPFGEIEQFYQDSRIGLGIFLPVSIFYYGIQIKTFEYMTFGLPVICSNFGNINRIVSETGTGIPIDPLSPVDISKALVRLLTDSDLYRRCSLNGIQAVKTMYNWKTEEKKLLDVYQNLAGLSVLSEVNTSMIQPQIHRS